MTELLGKLSLKQQKELEEKGLTSSKISEYLKKYQAKQKGYVSTLGLYFTKPFIPSQFIAYALEQNQKEKEIMNDLNLFPTKDEDTSVTEDKTTVKQTLIEEKQTDKKPNYLLFGLIGLGVIIGGFLIFKNK